jgi:seryl-tRNA synthetase
MLDIKLIRENPDFVRENIKRRNDSQKISLLDGLIEDDRKWRELQAEVNSLRAKRNEISKKISEMKKQKIDASAAIMEAETIPDHIKKDESEMEIYSDRIRKALLSIPNLLHESVPYGKDDSENVEEKRWGKQPEFDFEPKSHLEILEGMGMIDFERGAKVSGSGFYYLKGDAVKLDMALQKFAIDFLTNEKSFIAIEPPLMINRKSYEGMIDPADFENVTYKIEDEDGYLIATSEHPMGTMLKDEVLETKDLPLKFAGISPCFRKEIGTHGKYTKGLFRVHQFNKVEQFVFCLPNQSAEMLKELQENSEELYKRLGLHFRVVNICTGDMGSIAAKKFDIECWMADGKFRETGSNSNCTDYQARRLNIKYREGEGKPPIGLVHTLNNTALAMSRTMIAILEQFQQKDGTVLIPKALQPLMGGMEVLGKK